MRREWIQMLGLNILPAVLQIQRVVIIGVVSFAILAVFLVAN